MKLRIVTTALIVTLLAGCKSIEGAYAPGCVAYEGDNITLGGGRFTWEKFTDSVVVDDDGNPVNQFPGYPMQGSYRVEEQAVYMETDSGEMLPVMYLDTQDDRQYLLTAEQYESGEHEDCALVLDQD